MILAVNHLAPFVLTSGLERALRDGAPARVVNVGSTASDRAHLDLDDLELHHGWGCVAGLRPIQAGADDGHLRAGAAAGGDGGRVTVNVVHPGVVATNLASVPGMVGLGWNLAKPFMTTPEKGADTPAARGPGCGVGGGHGDILEASPPGDPEPAGPRPGRDRPAMDRDAAPGGLMRPDAFLRCVRSNPVNDRLLRDLPGLGLNQCHLTAGCLFQAVWNGIAGRAAEWGVKDYDVFYFDADVSWEAEDRVIRRVTAMAADWGVTIEVKNQARVHLWYEGRFGRPYPPLASARGGIDRYLVACTCIGIDVAGGEVYAPYGLADMQAGILRMNPAHPEPDLFRAKALDYQARWPFLTVADHEDRQ